MSHTKERASNVKCNGKNRQRLIQRKEEATLNSNERSGTIAFREKKRQRCSQGEGAAIVHLPQWESKRGRAFRRECCTSWTMRFEFHQDYRSERKRQEILRNIKKKKKKKRRTIGLRKKEERRSIWGMTEAQSTI
ncbi:uncharacterized protein LOC143034365 [Oratosquilla oratoria]|uniref:uncharacterized protein LOC143034365 n=1 Tax=Oratosquilla oratoria TaxID=337810 RepID=UPI003F77742A